ncbi:MAG: hypothetical protein QOG54_606 [Actinomycetota bacterium]|jgi:hypothetical protein|nr:hypothetical protein [Actinomycetota bacterium]
MRIEDRSGEQVSETTITVDNEEIIDLLQGLADVVEGKREHLHFSQLGGPQLVVRLGEPDEAEPLDRQMDWWVGPLILFGTIFVIIGFVTTLRWAIGLAT